MAEQKTDIEPCYRMLAARIEMIRKTLDVTQGELSKRSGLSRPSIANIELGRQRIYMHHVERVAQALGTTPKNLMRGIWF